MKIVPKYVVNAVINGIDNDVWGFNDLDKAIEKYHEILRHIDSFMYDNISVIKTIDENSGIMVCGYIK